MADPVEAIVSGDRTQAHGQLQPARVYDFGVNSPVSAYQSVDSPQELHAVNRILCGLQGALCSARRGEGSVAHLGLGSLGLRAHFDKVPRCKRESSGLLRKHLQLPALLPTVTAHDDFENMDSVFYADGSPLQCACFVHGPPEPVGLEMSRVSNILHVVQLSIGSLPHKSQRRGTESHDRSQFETGRCMKQPASKAALRPASSPTAQ